jgi:alpha/beta superfamily hydrolase
VDRLRLGDVLPAERSPVVLRTADGLSLVGELAVPLDRPPVATLVCLHPLPTHGGSMDSHLLRRASFRLPAQAGLAVLRFNTRGTSSPEGTSDGAFGAGEDERHDLAASLALVEQEGLPAPWLLGWSFGTDLALRYGCVAAVHGTILLSPPLRWSGPDDLARWARSGKPVTAIVPEHDDFLPPEAARAGFAPVPQAEVVPMPGAKHLLHGRAEQVLAEIVRRVVG